MNRPSMSRFAAGAACVIICLTVMGELSAQPTKKGPGGHPLAGRHGGLADLLEAADWPISDERPEQPDPQLRTAIQRLIDQRNQIIDRCNFFETVETIKKEEVELAMRLQVRQEAAKHVDVETFALQQVLALGQQGAQLQLAAQERVRQAESNLRNAISEIEAQQQDLRPIYATIQKTFGPLMQAYQDMRARLVPDRQDPNRSVVLEALEAATKWRDDFYEGHVLAALAQAYDGDAAGAERHLTAACVGFGRYGLFGTAWGADCCLAYLLLDQPKQVADYVAAVRKLDSKRQTPLLCWLVAQAAMLEGKDNEANTYFGRALTKMGLNDPKQPPIPEPLLGDAAFFFATAKNYNVRDIQKARNLLERGPHESTCWQVLRAQAAVLAAEGDNEGARQALDACRERAPGTLDARLEGILSGSVEETPASAR